MRFCVKSSSGPAQQHPETKYYSPAVPAKSTLAFFFQWPAQVNLHPHALSRFLGGGVFKGTSLQAGVLDPAKLKQIF